MASGLSWDGKSMGKYTGRMVPTSQPANSAANDGTSALLPESVRIAAARSVRLRASDLDTGVVAAVPLLDHSLVLVQRSVLPLI